MQKIFTDGASRGNPGPGGWGAIVLTEGTIIELGGREDSTTNNRMELKAVIEGLKKVNEKIPVSIYTDSSYVANGAQTWIHGWKRNNWMTQQKNEVLNIDLWKEMDAVLEGKEITWNIVKGHAGIAGNERCDEIATLFADMKDVSLFKGDVKDYKIDLDSVSVSGNVTTSSNRKGVKAFSYLSLVDGVLKKHSTWDECKFEVEGRSGAKYRKSISKEDEESIIESWGFKKPE